MSDWQLVKDPATREVVRRLEERIQQLEKLVKQQGGK